MAATSIVSRGFYVYLHRRATDGLVFYVGKGHGKRAWKSDKSNRNKHWLSIVQRHGFTVEIVQNDMQEWWAFELECELIAQYGRSNLCNQTDGGDGGAGHVVTQATRDRISLLNTGKKRTAEQNLRSSLIRIGISPSDTARRKISLANLGHVVTPETRRKIGVGNAGRKRDQKERDRIRAMNTGRVHTAEHKAKISAGLTGRPCSDETRKKIADAQKGRSVPIERRLAISASLTGKKQSEETKRKRADSIRRTVAARRQRQQLQLI